MAFGVNVNSREAPTARGAPTDTGTWFPVGKPASGATGGPKLVRSINEYEGYFGQRAGGTTLYDSVDVYFREGGKRAVVVPYAAAGAPDDGLVLLNESYGPGQVSIPGEDDPTIWRQLFQHAATNNRFAIIDATDTTADPSLLDNLITSVPAGLESYGAIFGPLAISPGPRGVVGVSSRNIPASAVIAGLCARVDATGNVNQAAAGDAFPLQYINDLKYDFTLANHEVLLNSGVNLMRDVFGSLQNYGFQTCNINDPVFWQANCGRERMALVAQAKAIGQHFMFKTLDGRGGLESSLKSALEGMLKRHWNANALFGASSQEAYAVEVGSAVNTVETIAQGELHAVAEARLSLHARSVSIDLVTVPVNQAIAA